MNFAMLKSCAVALAAAPGVPQDHARRLREAETAVAMRDATIWMVRCLGGTPGLHDGPRDYQGVVLYRAAVALCDVARAHLAAAGAEEDLREAMKDADLAIPEGAGPEVVASGRAPIGALSMALEPIVKMADVCGHGPAGDDQPPEERP
jgi:hypothetical protein